MLFHVKTKLSYLAIKNGELWLKRSHAYYSNIVTQIATKTKRCGLFSFSLDRVIISKEYLLVQTSGETSFLLEYTSSKNHMAPFLVGTGYETESETLQVEKTA